MKNNSFTNISSVFVKKHSTQQAIISLVDKITKSLDSGDIVNGVFFLKKAFDTVITRFLKKCLHMVSVATYQNGLIVI